MNLCVVDDFNPCECCAACDIAVEAVANARLCACGVGVRLRGRGRADMREHAIFALRNLLKGNAENQAVVQAIQPVGRWDEDKVLRDITRGKV